MLGTGAISVAKVSKVFPTDAAAIEALRDVDVDIEPGQFVSFVGPSGCGKSTLLKLIGGLLAPSTGEIRVGGREVAGPRRDIGVMFQTPVLFPWRTVLENVLLPIEVFGLDPRAATGKARDILRLVGLEERERAYPRELSGGMQQRAALSRVLVIDPPIILMDEPFGALDEFTRERMSSCAFSSTDSRPTTVLMTTGKNEMAIAITIFDSMPKPNHVIISGASTTLGITWNATTYG